MPARSNNFILALNGDYKEFADKLNSFGFKTLLLSENPDLSKPVSKHSDMQFITLNKQTFVLPNSDNLISFLKENKVEFILTDKAESKYPKDVLCNGKKVGNSLFCNKKTIDKKILDHAFKSGLNIINVKQGYTGCSIVKVNDNSIITSDNMIYKEAIKNNIDALLISEGNIKLKGYDYGFIGGCSGNIFNELIIFSGSLNNHPDKEKIRAFIKDRNIDIIELDSELTDIGGISVIELH